MWREGVKGGRLKWMGAVVGGLWWAVVDWDWSGCGYTVEIRILGLRTEERQPHAITLTITPPPSHHPRIPQSHSVNATPEAAGATARVCTRYPWRAASQPQLVVLFVVVGCVQPGWIGPSVFFVGSVGVGVCRHGRM